jgi:cytochrome c oxidase assembly factor CtaG
MRMGPGNMAPIRIDLHTLVRYWLISPFTCAVLAALVLAGIWYYQAASDAAEVGGPWPAYRTAAFAAGLVAVELAFQSSVGMLPYISFPMHVVQKLLLVVVAPPLLVLGTPLALALETSSATTTVRLLGVLRSAPVRAITQPVATFLLLYAGLLAYFLTPAVGDSMRHVWLLNLVNLGFLGAALLFWSAIIGAKTSPARILVILAAAAVVQSVLGIALVTKATSVAPIYTHAGTHAGRAILWTVTVAATVTAMIVVYRDWSRTDLLDMGDDPQPPDAAGFRLSQPG